MGVRSLEFGERRRGGCGGLTTGFGIPSSRSVNPESFESGTPQTVLFARVRKYVEQRPFAPFRIVTTSGRAYDVPTVDHVGLLPISRMILVGYDSGESVDIHALHIAAIEPLRKSRRVRAA